MQLCGLNIDLRLTNSQVTLVMGKQRPLAAVTPRASQPRRLPTELVDAVFLYLRPGAAWDQKWPHIAKLKADLCSCALVCRAWHDIALSHIFHDISYSYVASIHHWHGSLLVDTSSPKAIRGWKGTFPRKTLEMLYSLLRTRPDVASCVRQLRLQAWPGQDYDVQLELSEDEEDLEWHHLDNLDPDYSSHC